LPLDKTGFIPCSHCASTRSEEDLKAEIARLRITSLVFPEDGYDDDTSVEHQTWESELAAFKLEVIKFLKQWTDVNSAPLTSLVYCLREYLQANPYKPA
jgi:hypothetical protein